MTTDRVPVRSFDLRRLLLVPGAFALLMLVVVPLVQRWSASGAVNPAFVLLVVAPWLLGGLLLAVDRPAPFRFWLAPLLLATIAPALALCHDWVLLSQWQRTRELPSGLQTLAINTLLIGSFTIYLTHMLPRRCPSCGRVALIPLLRLWGAHSRAARTRWCTGCGGLYWRIRRGSWQKERRMVWAEKAHGKHPRVAADGPAKPDESGPASGTV